MADGNLLSKIVLTDESLFTREGVFNRYNSHYYSEVDPYLKHDRGFQHRWRLNIWAGICGDQILRPCLFDHYLDNQNYFQDMRATYYIFRKGRKLTEK